jgi:hypothetical protein
MNDLQIISIFLELVVAALGIVIAVYRRKRYGWFIGLTFVIYVFYDLVDLLTLNVSEDLMYFIFFVATLSILWAVWNIFLEA